LDNYRNQALTAKKLIVSSNELYRFTFPLNFVVDLSENDDLVDKGIDKSIEKEIRNILFIYNKIFNLFNIFVDDKPLYQQLLKSEVEYFLIRYRIVFDIIDKHLTKTIGIDKKKVDVSIYKSEEFLQLRDIRNKLAHEGIRCFIYKFENDPKLSFQIYDAGTLDNRIDMSEIFLDRRGTEIYFLRHYTTWLIIIMFNFLNKYFDEVKTIRLNGEEPSEETLQTIQYIERRQNHPLSRITFCFNELLTLQEGIDEFIGHIERYI